MGGTRRIVMLDDEVQLLELARRALTPPEFELHTFSDARDALMRLHEIRPELIVCDVAMPAMDGPSFFRVVKRSEVLRDVPFVYLSALESDKEILALLEEGADDFVSKPFPVARLVGKIRATLRLADRFTSADRERQYTLAGDVGPAGTIPLLKFCEDFKLTGRLGVDASGRTFWAEFQGGELLRCGAEPEEQGTDPLDALLAVDTGSYRIEQRPMDAAALRELESRVGAARAEPAPSAREGPPLLPGGRLSMVEAEGEKLQVQTEGENRPNFMVTTVVVREGQVIRRVESSWQHSLMGAEDLELAQSQIDHQHERVLTGLREGRAGGPPPRRPEAPEEGAADASLLAWALSFIAEQALGRLGVAPTVALLKRTRRRLASQKPVLLHFRVADNGRVAPEAPGPERLPADALPTVAEWAVAFLAEAAPAAPQMRDLQVRTVTRMIERELERAGFYAAFEAAAGVLRSG